MRRMNEKKEEEDDEAYFLRKLEEIKKKKIFDDVKPALIVQEQNDEFGGVEVWSTDSKEEEVSRLTHGRSFVAKDEVSQFSGRCLMVSNELSEQRGYMSDSCFAAKPVLEQISECEKMTNKVDSTLNFLIIHVSHYETELNDLKYTFSSFSDSLKRTQLTNSNLTDQLSTVLNKSEERRMWIEKLELELSRSRDELIYLQRDSLGLF